MRQTGEEYWATAVHAVRSDEDGPAGGLPPPRQPDAMVGYSILIYRLTDADVAAGAERLRTSGLALTGHRSMDRMTRAKKHGRRPASPSPGAASSGPRRDGRAPHGYWALAVGLSAVLVYLNAFGNDFVLDDIRIIRDNVRIRSLADIPALLRLVVLGRRGRAGAVPAAGARHLRDELRDARVVGLRLHRRQRRPARGRVAAALRARARRWAGRCSPPA